MKKVLKAVNLGQDTDTVGSTGRLIGILWHGSNTK